MHFHLKEPSRLHALRLRDERENLVAVNPTLTALSHSLTLSPSEAAFTSYPFIIALVQLAVAAVWNTGKFCEYSLIKSEPQITSYLQGSFFLALRLQHFIYQRHVQFTWISLGCFHLKWTVHPNNCARAKFNRENVKPFIVCAKLISSKCSMVMAFTDLVAPKGAVGFDLSSFLCSLAADPACQLDVLGHDGDSLGVDGAQVRVFKQANQVSFAGLLKGHHGGALEAQVGLEILSDLTDQALEGQLADQQLGGFLVATDLTESDSSRSVPVRFLHSTGGRRALSRCLSGELFSWSLSSSWLTGGLLGTCHFHESLSMSNRCDGPLSWRALFCT